MPDWKFIDSLKWSRKYRTDLPRHNLQYLREVYQIPANQAHRALDDVFVLQQIFSKMILDLPLPKIICFEPAPGDEPHAVRQIPGQKSRRCFQSLCQMARRERRSRQTGKFNIARELRETRVPLFHEGKSMNIAILGTGYIGSEVAALWTKRGHHVTATTASGSGWRASPALRKNASSSKATTKASLRL